ncbi:MAG TPA: zf-HC2 domain-containing protein [Candidatus Eremiobacteraeota bacterium]|nr:MAG: hypothetical protein BWY64_03861 [bacterium ADurb.Bin363]HPZ09504.1 zf-HC2 domain-containing protein [Candidatus Eremiobacteraeota bacterium]
MNCEEIELLIPDYINGELSIEINQLVEKHLTLCSSCKKNLEETKEIIENIRKISREIPEDLSNKIFLKESLLKELRIYRNTSPFLSALHRRKEEMKERIIDGFEKKKRYV